MNIRSHYLKLAQQRALNTQLDGVKMDHKKHALPKAPMHEPAQMPKPALAKKAPAKKGRGRPKGAKNKKKQSTKDKEDEKLGMEMHGVKDHEEMSGGAKKSHDLGMFYAKELLKADEDVKELHGAGFFQDFAKGFKKGFDTVMKPAMKVAKAIAPEFGRPGKIAKSAIEAVGYGKQMDETPIEKKLKKKGGKRKASPAMKKRGALVSKLMKEKGMKLGEASKYIKAHPELLK